MPRKIDLSKMGLVELNELQKDIDKAIANAQKAAKKTALQDVQKTAKKHGFSLDDLVGGKATGAASKTKAPPKYRNPSNASDTWTGRGRQPEWFKAAVENGTPREELEI